MSRERTYVYARIGRAGLGNELFAFMRAHEYAHREDATLLPSRWWKLRVGPYLRREADKREYWRLFRAPSLAARMRRAGIALFRRRDVVTMQGMAGMFSDLGYHGSWYRDVIVEAARAQVVGARDTRPDRYVSFHVRLGDFAQPTAGQTEHDRNNVSTPMLWYESVLRAIRRMDSEIPVLICSDGDDSQLRPLLALPGVRRSNALNAVDEMLVLADSEGIVGSRSTFSAWGAFLGETPLLVALGGNAYEPHRWVFEGEGPGLNDWWRSIQERRQSSSTPGAPSDA